MIVDMKFNRTRIKNKNIVSTEQSSFITITYIIFRWKSSEITNMFSNC